MDPKLFIKYARMPQTAAGVRATERGGLMQYFCDRLNAQRTGTTYPKISMARMGKILEQIPTKDLYYLKRVCDDAPHFSKKFWWELKPQNVRSNYGQVHTA